ncbi:Transcription factor iws1 [Paraconiothyrium brasiliense]|uniref:Transcription factor iws1 n=1 Tax=Paraconiothyrium brasiliense TaxID=300254 RepID=A0ABR3RB18_9PLEO
MEDVKFDHSHSNSPLPEAGNEPEDPLAPEVDEENGVNPPLGAPDQDMEVTESKDEMPDPDDVQEGGLSDNESVLSELDDQQFEDFDEGNIAIEERPAQVIDGENMNLIGVHKRKRAEGEGDAPKKKKKRADKPRRKKNRDDEVSGGDEVSGSRKGRSRKKTRAAEPDENDENLTPEERRQRALDDQIKALMKPSGGSRRRKKDGIDLEGMADAEIEDMRRRMASAAEADNEGRKRGEPARHKLKLLPEVVTMLNKNSIKDSIVDPEINLLEAVRFFLEPLSDGSLPAYDIQKELFAALEKLPITKDSLVASGIGKVIMFYCKSKRPELMIRRQAERLYTDWTRPILKRTDDYRKKEFAQADYDPSNVRTRTTDPQASQAAAQAAARNRALAPPTTYMRARAEAGPTTYTIVPRSNVVFNENNKGRSGDVDIMRKIRSNRGGGRR